MSGHDNISSSERWPRINMRSKIIPFFILIINPLVGMMALIIAIITPDIRWSFVFGVSVFVTLVYVTPPLELTYIISYNGLMSYVAQHFIGGTIGWAMLTLIGTALRFLSFVFRIEFRLYLAKEYCEIISRKSDNLEQIKYLSLVLDSYNSYLRKNIKFEIKGIRRIKSKFIACVPNEKVVMMQAFFLFYL
jgi:hypothetical protein